MSVTVSVAWAVLFWTHIACSNVDQYHLHALHFRGQLFPKHRIVAPRKYRYLDVQEEVSRERSGVLEQPFLQPWMDWIRTRQQPDQEDNTADGIDKAIAEESVASTSTQQQLQPLAPQSCVNTDNESEAATLPLPFLGSRMRKRWINQRRHMVTNVHELRSKILDEGLPLQSLTVECPYSSANAAIGEVLQHNVIQLMVSRYHTQSKPGFRHSNDTAYLALAIEGGGVRGAVCSGMAAAIAALGLTDSFDTVIGSSAGSVIGAYMVR
jgi:hypothetical protein